MATCRIASAWTALLVVMTTVGSPAWAATPDSVVNLDQAVDAIWRVRSVSFHFQSPTTYYYCDILQQRVIDIMRAVGAGEQMDVKARCAVGSLINDTTIRVVAGVPIEATAENVNAETTFDTHTRLIAQGRNWQLPTPTTVRRFRAVRTDVSFARMEQLHLTPSDCDLLQAMSEHVFPAFDIRPRGTLYCTPGSRPLTQPGLTVVSLMPISAIAAVSK
jgi:hypothetical protein